MKLPDLFVNAVTTFDGKALSKGQKQIGGFEKSVKSLGKAFGVTFGAAALGQFAKASLKAFSEDEVAAKRLTTAVKNLGLGFEDTKITRFISNLEKSAAVSDDILRPAFQSLISTTGSVTKSQDLLALALEISAGSGVDAATVAKDLSLAYLGQTKGLSKYNTGLTKTELAAAGFLTIQEKLSEQYSGQNAARLDTYAGKVSGVQIAYGNLQETVGGALVDAFMTLAGDTTVEDLTDSVDNLADSLAAVIQLTAGVAAPFVGLAKLFNDASSAYVKLLYKVTGTAFFGNVADRQYGGAAADAYRAIADKANAKARAAAEAAAIKRQKELLALQKKAAAAALATAAAKKLGLAIDKANLVLGKGGDVFDMEKIQLEAARISQVQQLAKATTAAQLLAITNDLARLDVLKKIKDLEDAIASGDIKRITAATEALNQSTKLLGVLTGQEIKLLQIKDILTALASKDLINLTNLNEAARILGLLNIPSGGKITVEISAAAEAALAALAAATAAAKLAAGTTKRTFTSSEINDIIRRLTSGQKITAAEGLAIGVTDPKSLRPATATDIENKTTTSNSPPLPTAVPSTFGDPALLASIIAAISIAATAAAENAAAIKAGNSQPVTVNNNFNGVIGDPNALASLITSIVQNAIDRGTIKAGTIL